jgi:hypothetical protein
VTYKWADTFNNAGGLIDLAPQPATPVIKPGRITKSLDNSVFGDGNDSTDLLYNSITNEQFGALLTQLGLSLSVRSNDGTIRLATNANRTTFANYNATVQLLEDPTYEKGFWNSVVFHVIIVEAL